MTTQNQLLRESLQGLLDHYVRLIVSGDAGHWDPEAEPVVIAARAAMARPVDGYRYALMGHGRVAIGHCMHSDTGTPGIIYLDLGGEQREIGADTSDVFPRGQSADPSKILACVHFLTPESVQQSIDVLRELLADQFGVTSASAPHTPGPIVMLDDQQVGDSSDGCGEGPAGEEGGAA